MTIGGTAFRVHGVGQHDGGPRLAGREALTDLDFGLDGHAVVFGTCCFCTTAGAEPAERRRGDQAAHHQLPNVVVEATPTADPSLIMWRLVRRPTGTGEPARLRAFA